MFSRLPRGCRRNRCRSDCCCRPRQRANGCPRGHRRIDVVGAVAPVILNVLAGVNKVILAVILMVFFVIQLAIVVVVVLAVVLVAWRTQSRALIRCRQHLLPAGRQADSLGEFLSHGLHESSSSSLQPSSMLPSWSFSLSSS